MCESVGDAFKELMAATNPFEAPDGQELIKPPTSLAGEEIRRHFLTSTGVVGAGQFGEVHLAQLEQKYETPTHRPEAGSLTVAVKMLKLTAPAEDRTEFVRECEAMFVLFLSIFSSSFLFVIGFEFCGCGPGLSREVRLFHTLPCLCSSWIVCNGTVVQQCNSITLPCLVQPSCSLRHRRCGSGR